MAEKIVQLSHVKLKTLANNYEEQHIQTDNIIIQDTKEKLKKSNKRPDRQIYQPGRQRVGQTSESSQPDEGTQHDEQPVEVNDITEKMETTALEDTHTRASPSPDEKQQQSKKQRMIRHPRKSRTATLEDPPTRGSPSPDEKHQSQKQRKNRRPDIQIYVPKRRSQNPPEGGSSGRSSRTSQSPGSKYSGTRYKAGDNGESGGEGSDIIGGRKVNIEGGDDMTVTVLNDGGSTTHTDGHTRVVNDNRQGRYSGNRRNVVGRRQRRRSTDSVGSVEFLDDGLEWDYQVDIDVEPKGEHGEEEIDFGKNFDDRDKNFNEDGVRELLSHDLESHDLPEYEGLPPQRPIQRLLGPDTYQTLQDLEISFSAEELSDQEGDQTNKKKKVRKKRTPRSQDVKDKGDHFNSSTQDSDSPREPGAASQDTRLIEVVHPIKEIDEQGEGDHVTRVVTETSEIRGRLSGKSVNNNNVKDLRVTVSHPTVESPKEPRKQRTKDTAESKTAEGKTNPRIEGRDPSKHEGRNSPRGEAKNPVSKASTKAPTNKNPTRKMVSDKVVANGDDLSIECDSQNLGKNKNRKVSLKKQDSAESNKSGEIRRETGSSDARKQTNAPLPQRKKKSTRHSHKEKDDAPKMDWGDIVELKGEEEMDFEHIEISSESSMSQSMSQSSSMSKLTPTQTPDIEKSGPGFGENVNERESYQRANNSARGRGRGRGQGNRGNDKPGSKQQSDRQSPAKEQTKFDGDRRSKSRELDVKVTSNKTSAASSDLLPRKPPEVTEYEMKGDSFSGLVITNSGFGGKNKGNRRRHVSGDSVEKSDRQQQNKGVHRRGSVDTNVRRNSFDQHSRHDRERDRSDQHSRHDRERDHNDQHSRNDHGRDHNDYQVRHDRERDHHRDRGKNFDRYPHKQDDYHSDNRKTLWNERENFSRERRRQDSTRKSPGREKNPRYDNRYDRSDSRQSERYRTTSHSSTEAAPTAKGGGILHLPPSSTANSVTTGSQSSNSRKDSTSMVPPEMNSQQSFPGLPQASSSSRAQPSDAFHHQQHRGDGEFNRGSSRGRGRGRGGSHRTLYDPNNPQPTQQQQQQHSNISTATNKTPSGNRSPNSSHNKPLHFHDSSEDSPPVQQQPNPLHFPGGRPPFVAGYMPPTPPLSAGGFPMQQPHLQHPRMRMGPGPMMGIHPQPARFRGPQGFYGHPAYYGEMPMAGYPPMGDNYYQDYEGVEGSRSKSKSACREKAEGLIPVLQAFEGHINNLLTRRVNSMEDFTRIMSAKKDYQGKCVEIMMIDPETANTFGVEQLLWKNAFYQVIELLKKQMSSGDGWEPDMLRQSLMGVLDEGNNFYDKLLSDLQSEYGFSLPEFYDPLKPYPSSLNRNAKLSLYTTHICLLCLGDLARYREQIMQSSNFGKARSWYIKAQQVMPKNGRPYNQLAILAMYTKRKLEAVYYFMRSLAASNPFLNGREILMSIFDEIRKKAEVTEKRRLADKEKQRKRPKPRRPQGYRVEIWIHLDGTSSEDRIEEETEENELLNLSTMELNKRFTLSFLNVHGKLFTKIGWDHFPEISSQMLHELKALLQHTPCPLSVTRLTQLVTINMFAVHNSVSRDHSQLDENCRPLVQEYAVQLGLDMYALIAERCIQLLQEHIELGDRQIFNEEVRELMPSIVMWTNWMTVHLDLWNPPPLSRDPELGPVIDVWQKTADLLNLLNKVDTSSVTLHKTRKNDYEFVLLEEGSQMAGFTPLSLFEDEDRFMDSSADKAMARDCLRIERFIRFTEFLAGIEPPLLKWNAQRHTYVAVIKDVSESRESDRESRRHINSESDDVVVESESEDELNLSGETPEFMELKAKKEKLKKQVAEKENQEQKFQAVLDNAQADRQMALQVCPQFLLPDTNCFIDHLVGITKILYCKKFTVVVPLVVINELDGLSKGSKEGQYDSFEHAEKVKKGAKSAVDFLEKEFECQTSNLRAITGQGNVMNTISFRSEEMGQQGSNDDVILSCCLHYCKDKARDFMPRDRDGPITLSREVVLLTDDRNLRLKAHTRNVPVKDIPHFLRWAKIT